MQVKAKLSNLRTAPRKVRQVANLVRGKDVIQAQSMLLFTVNKSARNLLKLLNSAVASAKHDFQLNESNLFISKITVDEGPKLKRWHPMSRGRAYPILKRTSHIVLVLEEKNPSTKEVKSEEKSKTEKVKKEPVAIEAVKKTSDKKSKKIKSKIKSKK